MQYTDINTENIILRKPVPYDDGWFCAVWYKAGRNSDKLIVRSPRLRVMYGAKKFESSYCYCVSLADRDIDDDVNDFFQFIKKCDTAVIAVYKKNNKEWGILPAGQKIVYKPALTRKTKEHEYYLKLKLIQEKTTQNILTSINSCERTKLTVDDIEYGKYTDQFIEFSGITILSDGTMIPVWYAHQIVVSPYRRVFLSKSLLDDITPTPTPTLTPPLASVSGPVSTTSVQTQSMPSLARPPSRSLPLVSKDLLLDMKSKLKSVQIIPAPEPNPVEQANTYSNKAL